MLFFSGRCATDPYRTLIHASRFGSVWVSPATHGLRSHLPIGGSEQRMRMVFTVSTFGQSGMQSGRLDIDSAPAPESSKRKFGFGWFFRTISHQIWTMCRFAFDDIG